jgi:SAM-dependent methyltransferase
MNHEEVGRYWNENAAVWTSLARAGYDVYRDHLNTPAFFEFLPRVVGLSGLDIGCGEGHNTRLLAKRGARVTAIDISGVFIGYAQQSEEQEPLGIDYGIASAVELPFADATFDFAVGFMSFMDIPETERLLAEAHRVIKPGGFLQFSIEHPSFATPHRRNLRNQEGRTYAIEVGDYFRNLHGEITEWIFGATPPEVKKGLRTADRHAGGITSGRELVAPSSAFHQRRVAAAFKHQVRHAPNVTRRKLGRAGLEGFKMRLRFDKLRLLRRNGRSRAGEGS